MVLSLADNRVRMQEVDAMNIVRWNPLDLVSPSWWESRIGRWPDIGDFLEAPALRGWPSMDVYSEGADLIVEMELPGMKAADVDINLEKDRLRISGKQVREEKIEKEDFFRKERFSGSFTRVIPLQKDVGEDGIRAEMKDGLLTIRVKEAGASIPGKQRIPIEEK